MFDLKAEIFLKDDLEAAKERYLELAKNLQNAVCVSDHSYTIGKMLELEAFIEQINFFTSSLTTVESKEAYLKELLRNNLRENTNSSPNVLQNAFKYYTKVGKRKFLELFLKFR